MKPSTVNAANNVVATVARPTHVTHQQFTVKMVMKPNVTWNARITLSPLSNAETVVLVGFFYLIFNSDKILFGY